MLLFLTKSLSIQLLTIVTQLRRLDITKSLSIGLLTKATPSRRSGILLFFQYARGSSPALNSTARL